MDNVSIRSGVINTDTADETNSLVDERWSDDEAESSDPQGPCFASPQAPLPTYKQRFDEFKKTFKELPETEKLIADYTCALQRDILLQGRLYLSENCLCFYSNVFRGTKIILNLKDIMTLTKEKTARLIPNAIQVCTSADKTLTSLELCQMVKQHYGYDLGLSHEEMESLLLSAESSMQTRAHPSLRLPGIEQGPLEASTPQTEDLPSPVGSQTSNSLNVEDSRRSPMLDRAASERVSKRSSLSLDLNANENGISEESGSESVDEVEDRAGFSQVAGRLCLNKVFHISANKMFEMLFTDSSFTRRFMDVKKMTNPSFTPWQTDASGNKKRSLNYTITISNPLTGKFSAATENQTLYKESREGQYYLVDSDVYAHDILYHDYFYTQNRYYIISNSKRKCRLRVYTDVKYVKQPWGLVKSIINKNSLSGVQDYFRQLEAELLKEEAELNQGSGDVGKGGLRRRRRTYSRSNSEHAKSGTQYGQNAGSRRNSGIVPTETIKRQRWNVNTIIAAMSFILLILTLLNLALFFKLWAMEDVAHRMYLSTKHRMRERSQSSMVPDYGAAQGPGYPSKQDLHLLKNQKPPVKTSDVRDEPLVFVDLGCDTMKKRTKKALDEEDTLCCCEYVNGRGERSHVAACCCDCEDLDDVCDRFLKREPQKPDSLSKVAEVLTDRIRVPWLWVLLHIAALHFLLGVLVLIALPGLVLWYYYVTHRKKGRTLFFLSMALFSLAYMYYLFVTVVVPRGDVATIQLAIITMGVIFTLAALIRTKKGPGVVLPNRAACHSNPVINGMKHEVMLMERTGVSEHTEGTLKESHRKNWCSVCKVVRPPRAGHCRICGVCVLRLDHHCVWINSCVGQANHLSFLLTLISFLLTSLFGICLVLQSPALCFTCAWYSSIVTGGLLHLLLVQVINISYNVTEREARIALREKTAQSAFWGLIVDTQVYSKGFWVNWSEFFSMRDKVNLASLTPADVV
ncbi:hypothetical protein WMY93_030766 [Mugilogobius chulae]|uniref:VASt domain-containing protein n=1 Tax=Mugilogobius chulae TaxID=88201 RepID=A0AAW0ML27_9GOBI